jgi:hypothetical protein
LNKTDRPVLAETRPSLGIKINVSYDLKGTLSDENIPDDMQFMTLAG